MPHLLILGAASDIAQATAYSFAKHGFHLTLAARNVDRLETLKNDLVIKHSIQVELKEFDACDFASHLSFYQSLISPPDVAMVCFGYLGDANKFGKDFEEAHKIIDVNLTGAVSICDILANDFEERQSGTIIGISSVAGDRGRKGNYTYGAAKAAYRTYLSGLRQRLFSANVHVLDVRPGFIATQMTAGLQAPQLLVAYPDRVGEDIYKAFARNRNVCYTPWFWFWIMQIIKFIPEPIFKRMNIR